MKLVLRSSIALVALTCVLIASPVIADAAGLKPLHATRGKHAAIVDGNGRQVILRTMNVSSLQDNYQPNPNLPGSPRLSNTDLARMRGMGINAIRLVINWSALEPRRGQLSPAYVSQIKRTISRAASYGMYTVIDMHNDGWSKYVYTHRGAKCPKGLRPTHGWDGAPKWATFTNGKTTCIATEGKRSDAVKAAWANFWRNHRGIRKAYTKTWGKLAGALAKQPGVAGFDILNAPDGGGIDKHKLIHKIDKFNKKTIKAIRKGEKRRHGRKHIIFFEPNITWRSSGLKFGSPTPGFTHDRNIAFAPHLYGGVSHGNPNTAQLRKKLKKQAKQIAKRAAKYKAPVWLGEWGVDMGPHAAEQAGVQRSIQEQHLWGGAWWQWEISCGNPHLFSGPFDRTPKPNSGTINPVQCPAGTPLPRPTDVFLALSHPVPRAAPGKLRTLHTRTNGIKLTGSTNKCGSPAACQLVVWSKKKMRVSGKHLKQVKPTQVPDGYLTRAQVHGRYKFVGKG